MKEKKEGRKNQTVIFHVTSKASPRWNLSKGLQKVSEGVACVSEEGYPAQSLRPVIWGAGVGRVNLGSTSYWNPVQVTFWQQAHEALCIDGWVGAMWWVESTRRLQLPMFALSPVLKGWMWSPFQGQIGSLNTCPWDRDSQWATAKGKLIPQRNHARPSLWRGQDSSASSVMIIIVLVLF